MAKKKRARKRNLKSQEDIGGQDSVRLHAFVATFLSIIGFIIALLVWKDEEYTMYYSKQSLVIFIVALIAQVIAWSVSWIFIIGRAINVILGFFVFIIWLLSWIYALSDKKKEVPIVGEFAKKINL